MGAVRLRAVDGHGLLQVYSGRDQLSEGEHGLPQLVMGPREVDRLLRALGQAQEVFRQFPRRR